MRRLITGIRKECLELRDQWRDMLNCNTAESIVFDLTIVVGQHVSLSLNGPPRDFRVGSMELIRDPPCSLANDLYLALDSAPQHEIDNVL